MYKRQQGIHVIGYMESGFRDVFSKKPIQTMADFNGVKIRTGEDHGPADKEFHAYVARCTHNSVITCLLYTSRCV